jgi:hypothetical protein
VGAADDDVSHDDHGADRQLARDRPFFGDIDGKTDQLIRRHTPILKVHRCCDRRGSPGGR